MIIEIRQKSPEINKYVLLTSLPRVPPQPLTFYKRMVRQFEIDFKRPVIVVISAWYENYWYQH